MTKKICPVIVALGLTTSPALAACDTDVIELVASDGEILITPRRRLLFSSLAANRGDHHLR